MILYSVQSLSMFIKEFGQSNLGLCQELADYYADLWQVLETHIQGVRFDQCIYSLRPPHKTIYLK